jgi:hypothetical protein
MAFTGNWACDVFKTGMMNGVYNFTSGNFYIALYTNSASLDQTTQSYTNAGETSGSGYTLGGQLLTVNTTPTTGSSGDIAYVSFANAVWTGSISARGALIYLNNGTTNPAVCVLDFGSAKASTNTFTVQFPAATNTSAIIRIS